MAGLRIAVVFSVLVQMAVSQNCNCQTELFISIDDLVRALNNGPGIPGLIDSNQDCGCQPINVNQCGCQPSINVNQCGYQPVISQQCGCQSASITQPSVSINTLPGLSIGQSCGCNQPSISVGQPTISLSQPCNQPLSVSALPQLSNQASFSVPTPTINLGNLQIGQCGCSQPSSCGPSISVSRQNCDCQRGNQIISSGNQVISSGNQVFSSGNQVISSDCVVPAALLQAPPYGIVFAGDNLLIDGAVQVCGNMPFSSVVEFGGVLPSNGAGCVQYVCNDLCA